MFANSAALHGDGNETVTDRNEAVAVNGDAALEIHDVHFIQVCSDFKVDKTCPYASMPGLGAWYQRARKHPSFHAFPPRSITHTASRIYWAPYTVDLVLNICRKRLQ
jgi:hypothetical protein